ncbi:MAG: hypothetical protein M1305_02605 [Candidatus Marsarchaeota archaeon]|nr:hypothetical protein [Candidatus Marsarchaeota archaeon]
MPTADEIKAAIKSLDVVEAKVLYLKCQELTHPVIAELMDYSISSINNYSSRMYVKLGFKREEHHTVRRNILKHIYCPILSDMLGGFTIRLDDPIWDTWPPTTGEPTADPITRYMVLVDEEELRKRYPVRPAPDWLMLRPRAEVVSRPAPIPPAPVAPRRRDWSGLGGCLGVLLFAAIGILGVYFVGILGVNLLGDIFPTRAPASTVAVAPTPRPTITRPPPATAVPRPTPKPLPTATPVPLPFEDTFDSGELKPEWEQRGAVPMLAGNIEGAQGFTLSSGSTESWLYLPKVSAADYEIEVRVSQSDCPFAGNPLYQYVGNTIIVRMVDYSNLIYFEWNPCHGSEWFILERGTLSLIPNTTTGNDFAATFAYKEFISVVVIVEGNRFRGYVNQVPQADFILPADKQGAFASGGIGLEIMNSNTHIDFVKVRPLP